MMMHDLEGLRASIECLAHAADLEPNRLRECSADLRERLLAFLEREDSILLRALEETDCWGPDRLQMLRREHASDWAAVGELARAAEQPDVDLVALALRAKILRLDLRRDLDQEERCLLIAEVLQDDESSSDQSDG